MQEIESSDDDDSILNASTDIDDSMEEISSDSENLDPPSTDSYDDPDDEMEYPDNPYLGRVKLFMDSNDVNTLNVDTLLLLKSTITTTGCNIWCIKPHVINTVATYTGNFKGQDSVKNRVWEQTWPRGTPSVAENNRRYNILKTNEPFANPDVNYRTLPLVNANRISITKEAVLLHRYFWKCTQLKVHINYLSRKGDDQFLVISFTDSTIDKNHPSSKSHVKNERRSVYENTRKNTHKDVGRQKTSNKYVQSYFDVKPVFEVQLVIRVKDLQDMVESNVNVSMRLSGYHDIMDIRESLTYKLDNFSHFDNLVCRHKYERINRNANSFTRATLDYDAGSETFVVSYTTDNRVNQNFMSYSWSKDELLRTILMLEKFPIDRRSFVNPRELNYLNRQYCFANVHPMCLSEMQAEMEADESLNNLIPEFYRIHKPNQLEQALKSKTKNMYVNKKIKRMIYALNSAHTNNNLFGHFVERKFMHSVDPAFTSTNKSVYVLNVLPDHGNLLDMVPPNYLSTDETYISAMMQNYYNDSPLLITFLGSGSRLSHPLIPEGLPGKHDMLFFNITDDVIGDKRNLFDFNVKFNNHPRSKAYKSFNMGKPNVNDVNELFNDRTSTNESIDVVFGFKQIELLKLLYGENDDYNDNETLKVTMFGMFTFPNFVMLPADDDEIMPTPTPEYDLTKVMTDGKIMHIYQEIQIFHKHGESFDASVELFNTPNSGNIMKIKLFDQVINNMTHSLTANLNYKTLTKMIAISNDLHDAIEKETKRVNDLYKSVNFLGEFDQ